jgi:hypothetical protein
VQRLDAEAPAVVVADLDMAEVTRVRERHAMLACRVADLGGRTLTPAR